MPDIKIEDLTEAVKGLREEVDKKLNDQNPEKLEKINAVLDAQEEKNQALVADIKAREQEALDLKEQVEGLELRLAHGDAGKGLDYKDTAEYKALNAFAKGGESKLSVEEKQLLRTDSDPDGGYLVTSEMESFITKKITEVSNVRSIARTRTISSKSLEVPVRNTILQATFEGEAESAADSTSTYQSETLTAYRQTVNVPITWDMLNDSSFDMVSEIMQDASESFAQGEGLNFVTGDGVKKPQGFLNSADSRITAIDSINSSIINADDVILLTGELKTGYNPVYTFNRKTLAFLRTLKSADGVFLWQPGMNGPVANTINGFPYISAIDMGAHNVVADEPVAFGDFMRGYTIVDRTGMSIIRDEVTQKKKAIVEFNIKRWLTGQVTLPEAIVTLKVKA